MSIALSLFTIGNLSSFTALTAVLAGVGILSTLQTAIATTITGGGYRANLEAYNFENLTSGSATSILNTDDDNSSLLPADLNFSFKFFGVDYNRFQVSSNGFLALGTSPSLPATDSRPTNLDLNNLTTNIGPTIAAFWDNLSFTGPYDRAYYAVRGTGNDRRLIVQWNQAGVSGTNNNGNEITFQAVLFENSSDILLSYADTFFATDVANNNGGSATVGISDGQVNGQRLQWSYNTAFSGYAPPQGRTIRFRREP